MPITIGSNIASLTAQRRLAEGTSQLSKTYERLSSGLRINKASDDAAGLAIADSLRADSRVFLQGVRNLNDGISLLNIADSAIENLTSIVVRLEELAEQAANGTYGVSQRKAINAEAQALSKEFFRISKTTSFNGINLLSGTLGQVNLQAGVGTNAVLSAGVGGAIGSGSFNTAGTLSTESEITYDVELYDLNGDGNLDMLTGGSSDSSGGGYFTLRLGNGNGGFGTAVSYATEGGRSRSLAVGDLNGDGHLDVLTGGLLSSYDGFVTLRFGNGNGTFGSATSYASESKFTFGAEIGDVDNDGDLDIVSAGTSDSNDGFATVRLNNGSGVFGAAVSYDTEGRQSKELALGDINGDGNLDIVTAGYSDANLGFMTVRLGMGNGTFAAATSYTMAPTTSLSLDLGDLNGDGLLDVVTVGFDAGLAGVANVRLGNGNGTFGNVTSYQLNGLGDGVELADLNGDGFLDLSVAEGYLTGGSLTLFNGNGDGTFSARRSYATQTFRSEELAIADINNDGVLDIVAAGANTGSPSQDGVVNIFTAITNSGVNPILPFSLSTIWEAKQSLPMFQQKRTQLAAQRGQIGAFQSRIQVATNVLQAASENFKAAESRIRDADIASEAAELARQNILQKAASAILAQANQQPALALRLLQGGV